jgi:hypothetical protein
VVLPTPPFVDTTANVITLLSLGTREAAEARPRGTWQLGLHRAAEPLHPFKLARQISSGRVIPSTLFYYEIAL